MMFIVVKVTLIAQGYEAVADIASSAYRTNSLY